MQIDSLPAGTDGKSEALDTINNAKNPPTVLKYIVDRETWLDQKTRGVINITMAYSMIGEKVTVIIVKN